MEPLPTDCHITSTGYVKDQHKTTPTQHDAYSIFPNLAMQGHRDRPPLLHTIKNKDPLREENDCRGPAYYSTEHHTQYIPRQQHVDVTDKSVGPFEDTGFTRSKNTEPVTHYPDPCYQGNYPTLKSLINPPVPSIMKTSYQPSVHPTGGEKMGEITSNANRDTGFTRFIQPTGAHTGVKGKVYTKLSDVNNPFAVDRIKKTDPAEYMNMTNPNPYPSLSRSTYAGKQIHEPDINDKLGRKNLGKKENTGHTDNNKSYYTSPKDLERFNTLYNKGYYDKSRPAKTEYDRIYDASSKDLQEDGYTKSEKLHPAMDDYDAGRQLKFLHPYVNRSLKARDPFYGENKYVHKNRSLLIG